MPALLLSDASEALFVAWPAFDVLAGANSIIDHALTHSGWTSLDSLNSIIITILGSYVYCQIHWQCQNPGAELGCVHSDTKEF